MTMLTEVMPFRHPAWHVVAQVDGEPLAIRVFLERHDHQDDTTLEQFGDLSIEVATPDGSVWSRSANELIYRSERSVEAQFCPVTLGRFRIRWYRTVEALAPPVRYQMTDQVFTIERPGPVFHRSDDHPGKEAWAARWAPNAPVPTRGN